MRNETRLDKRAAELGEVVHEIIKRFEGANVAAANGPHADLTHQETRVVELLGAAGGQMMRAVANHLGIAVNSVTTLADNLERKGLLQRVRSEADRRVVHVELTAAGQRAGRSVIDVKAKFHREMLAALTDEEQAILLVLLRKIGGVRTAGTAGPTSSTSGDSAAVQSSSSLAVRNSYIESVAQLKAKPARTTAKRSAAKLVVANPRRIRRKRKPT